MYGLKNVNYFTGSISSKVYVVTYLVQLLSPERFYYRTVYYIHVVEYTFPYRVFHRISVMQVNNTCRVGFKKRSIPFMSCTTCRSRNKSFKYVTQDLTYVSASVIIQNTKKN